MKNRKMIPDFDTTFFVWSSFFFSSYLLEIRFFFFTQPKTKFEAFRDICRRNFCNTSDAVQTLVNMTNENSRLDIAGDESVSEPIRIKIVLVGLQQAVNSFVFFFVRSHICVLPVKT